MSLSRKWFNDEVGISRTFSILSILGKDRPHWINNFWYWHFLENRLWFSCIHSFFYVLRRYNYLPSVVIVNLNICSSYLFYQKVCRVTWNFSVPLSRVYGYSSKLRWSLLLLWRLISILSLPFFIARVLLHLEWPILISCTDIKRLNSDTKCKFFS